MSRLLFLFFLFPILAFGQNRWKPNAGIKATVLITFGSHQNSLGLKLDSYLGNDFTQLNAGVTTRYFLTNFGNRSNFGELRLSAGGGVMFGKGNNPLNMDWEGTLHQSKSEYSIGYAHYWYLDRIGTAQRSGAWNIGIQRFDILMENDVFGGQAKDRFRTGGLIVSYRDSLYKASIGLAIWTGETGNTTWDRTPRPGAPNGIRDLTNNPFGKLNHGILYGEIKHRFVGVQTVGGRIGWDSEQIRHVFQNKISHDLVLLPKKMKRNTPHYPRLNEEGENVFTKKEVRKPRFYFQTFLNDGLPY
ncbi:polymorphic toxin type 23 domain-containing protein [Fluviicola taffensis]|uniref:Bacterial toxin 23 domain-containing protein n=1 Tax=Fluviicola taffensis (strain DSM 16823 / NCIMB 13979 / RW262) TaxID=755732 RepID=F2ID63_FLUTR|nr:polymorphic toxin type 23 domain-containing protein [Fluviicola taffensis]AEA45478.1 hypothetical protein Fluta_3507 [Fluviicola taffensis DSM 16823]